jgi:hypothetical protein
VSAAYNAIDAKNLRSAICLPNGKRERSRTRRRNHVGVLKANGSAVEAGDYGDLTWRTTGSPVRRPLPGVVFSGVACRAL